MPNLMSAPRKALLEHLAGLEPPKGEREDRALEIAGVPPPTAAIFIRVMVEDDLIRIMGGYGPAGSVRAIFITEAGREAPATAVVVVATESRKVDDRSAELAKIIANPASVRATVSDLHQHLVLDQPPEVARRNIAQVEQLLSSLNGVARMHAGAR